MVVVGEGGLHLWFKGQLVGRCDLFPESVSEFDHISPLSGQGFCRTHRPPALTECMCCCVRRVTLTFMMPGGERCEAKAKVGDNLLDVIIENDVDIDGYGQ